MDTPATETVQADRQRAGYPTAAWRHGILVASLSALLFSCVAAADEPPSTPLAVWAIGLPNGYVIMKHQAPAVHVTADDVARGVVDVKSGTRIVITTVEPSGIAVDFHSPGKLFRSIQIDGIGGSAHFGPAGGTIVESQAAVGRRVIAINYRFTLAPDTASGTYVWPISIAVRHPVPRDIGAPTPNPNSPNRYARGGI
jgi:hypothetical protein